jgi:O-6-methylguanine DNA methyltransferase
MGIETVYVHQFETALGLIRTAATRQGLVLIALPGESKSTFESLLSRLIPHTKRLPGGQHNLRAERQINEYLKGKRRKFTVKLQLRGTAFQRLALQQVAAIPYGRTMSYGQIAEAIGHPMASRAVGSANAGNNLPIVIPCHRVVAANGLGGYGGGLPMKIKLLQIEGALKAGRS